MHGENEASLAGMGKRRRTPEEKALIKEVPSLKNAHFEIASPPTKAYNCVAWAADCSVQRWDPLSGYWPDTVERDVVPEALLALYLYLGFEVCDSDLPEEGFQKVAIYAKGSLWTHAARQLDNGSWTSKLGDFEDILHESPRSLEGEDYGAVRWIMKKPRQEEEDLF